MQSSPNRARITLILHVSGVMHQLVSQARRILDSSRETARLARSRITGSRKRLSQAGDNVVASAASISAARSAMQRRPRAF